MAGGGLGGLPARLAELLTARVSDCGPQAWPLLAAMSVAGRALTEDQLAGVTGLDAGALRAGLRELASRSLAETAPGGRHRARHALLAEAAAARLLPGERRGLHERLGRSAAGGRGGAGRRGRRSLGGRGPGCRGAGARLTAARAAERVSGYAEAAAHWQRAIELAGAPRPPPRRAGIGLPGWYLHAIDARHLAGDAEGPGRWPRRPAAGSPATPIRRSRRWSASAPRGSAASATCSSAGGREAGPPAHHRGARPVRPGAAVGRPRRGAVLLRPLPVHRPGPRGRRPSGHPPRPGHRRSGRRHRADPADAAPARLPPFPGRADGRGLRPAPPRPRAGRIRR